MAALTRFVKRDNTVRTTTSTTAVEATDYTVAWADLTGAGLAAGDDVVILVSVRTTNSSGSGNSSFQVGFGTTYAGRADVADSASRAEPHTSTGYDGYGWVDRRTLVTSENIYFSILTTSATTASFGEFTCLIFKLADLPADAWFYAEQTHAGDAPTAFNTSGASASIPATGDWLLAGASHWLMDNAAATFTTAIHDGTADIATVTSGGNDTADERAVWTWAYKAGLAASTTVRTRYLTATNANLHNCDVTKIFGLRLDAFEDHAGAHTTNTITHSALDTYQEFAGFGSFGLSTTGPLIVIGWPIDLSTELTKRPYGRIQIDGADWPSTDYNRLAAGDNDAAARMAPFLFGYVASQGAGTLDIDLDCANDADASPSFTCPEQVAVAFSLTLAVTGAVLLAGTCSAASGTAAVLKAIRPVAGAADSLSATAAALARAVRLSGAAASASAALADTPSRGVAFAGTCTGSSAITGTIARTADLAGTSAAISAASAAVKCALSLAGQAPAVSTLAGAINRAARLAGTCAASSAATADLAIPGQKTFVGVIASTSALTAGLKAARPLAGTVTAASAATATLQSPANLAGVCAATSAVSGTLSRAADVAGEASVVSTALAGLLVVRALAGANDSASTASASLVRMVSVTGLCAGISAAAGALLKGEPQRAACSLAGTVISMVALRGEVIPAVRLAGRV